jgi:apolipoprotein N-acyltransferase
MPRARAYPSAILAGGALTLSFPEPSLWPVAWMAFPFLLVALEPPPGAGKRAALGRGAILGGCFGIAFFATLLYWISVVGFVAWGALVLLQTVFLVGFGAATGLLLRHAVGRARSGRWGGGAVAVLGPPVAWVAFEYLRALVPFGGFTWGQLSQSQAAATWMLRPTALAGGWVLSFTILLAGSLLAAAWRRRTNVLSSATAVLAAVAVFAFPLTLPSPSAEGEPLRVAMVQGNVPRDFEGTVLAKELTIVAEHERLTVALADGGVDLVVWPESSVGLDPFRWPEVSDAIERAARAVDAPMLVGATLDIDEGERYHVTMLEIDPSGDITDVYRKTHLVPFGEYVPWRGALGWIPMLEQVPRDAVPGDEPKVFDVAGGEVATVISYEGDFGPLVRRAIDEGGRLLVVATNTSTWGETWASAQHLAFSRVRAVENGVWVAHAALSGISAFVAPDGTLHDETPLWTATTAVRELRFAEDETFYTRTGDWLAVSCLVAAALLLAWSGRADKSASVSA